MTHSDGPILVTGGAGYIGSHTVLALGDAGFEVVVVDDLSTGHRRLVPTDVPLVVGDVADTTFMTDVLARHSPSAVMHFAGSIVAEESVHQPAKYYGNNTVASLRLIETCVAHGIETFLFSSTAAIYGNASRIPIAEDSSPAPVNPYGWSKWMTERILADVAVATPLRFGALRYFNVAGADPELRSGPSARQPTHLMRLAAQSAVGTRADIAIFGTDYGTPDGTCIRDYVHVSDLAEAHVAALRHLLDRRESFVLNVGYGRGYSVREVLATFKALGNGQFAVREEGRRAGDIAMLVADTSRIRSKLGWRPRYDDLAFIVKTALAWERHLAERPME